jgi:hypothetical protein
MAVLQSSSQCIDLFLLRNCSLAGQPLGESYKSIVICLQDSEAGRGESGIFWFPRSLNYLIHWGRVVLYLGLRLIL